MNLAEISPFLLHHFPSEADLSKAILEVSQKFTTDRGSINDYLQDKRLTSAYTAFYLTTNIPKFEAILPWMDQRWLEAIAQCDLIDLGAGPGTFSLAWKQWLGDRVQKIYQIEKSALMREQARKIWDGFYPSSELIQLTQWKEDSSRPKILLFGHSANEMGPELVMKFVSEIKPEHILFIEPGTKSFFSDMLTIRRRLLQENFQVLYPCPKAEECPMLGTEDWCHQFIEVRHHADVERLSQLVQKDRKLLPLIVHAYSKSNLGERASERVVRVLPETKFSFEWEVCHQNHLEHYQVMKRNMNKAQLKRTSQIMAGDAVETEMEKEFEGTKRVKLKTRPEA